VRTLYIIFLIIAMVISLIVLGYVVFDIILVHMRARHFKKKDETDTEQQNEETDTEQQNEEADAADEDGEPPMENVTEEVV